VRTADQNAVLQVLIDAGSSPVSLDEVRHRAAAMLPPGSDTVYPDDTDAWVPPDEGRGSAYQSAPRARLPHEVDPGALRVLQQDGWVLQWHTVRRDGATEKAITLAGLSPLPPLPRGLSPFPVTAHADDPADSMLAWLLSGGAAGRREGTGDAWAGRLVGDDERMRLTAELASRGYRVDRWWDGSSDPLVRVIAVPGVPLIPPPRPGTDARMITRPGEEPPVPVGLTEIAQRAGVDRETAEQWTRRHSRTFPVAQWPVGGRRAWDWREVRAWLQATGRLPADA
jgi:hypothetical protein